jgi:type I restriction enzyme, S subunit
MKNRRDEVRENPPKISTRVPRLRFPEFRNMEGWLDTVLSGVSDLVNDKVSVNQLSVDTYINTECILPDYRGVIIPSRVPAKGSVTYFRKNDILASNIRPYLKKIWFSDKEGGASNDVLVVRPNFGIDSKYLSFLLINDAFVTYMMKGAKGLKMPRGDISLIMNYPLAIPSINEQQKIADCLTSLDSLLAAHTQKLDALKAYKKGLMQQLFPAEGESVPRLRFPEFRDAPEWEETKLMQVVDLISGQHLLPEEYNTDANGVPYFSGPSDFVDRIGAVGKWTINSNSTGFRGDILITVKGSGVGTLLLQQLEAVAIGRQLMAIRPRKIVGSFLYQMLLTMKSYFEDLAAGNMIPGLSRSDLLGILLFFPSLNEQRKIAECLSSLDDLISVQSTKIDSLKQHKKALMQQLFPQAEEADS